MAGTDAPQDGGTTGGELLLGIPATEFSRLIHDINNSLGTILGGLELLLASAKDEQTLDIVEDALSAASSAVESARRLQQARRQPR